MRGAGVLGVVIERFAYRPLRNAPKLAPLVTAIGVSFILENGMQVWQGGGTKTYPQLLPSTVYTIAGTTVSSNIIVVVVAAHHQRGRRRRRLRRVELDIVLSGHSFSPTRGAAVCGPFLPRAARPCVVIAWSMRGAQGGALLPPALWGRRAPRHGGGELRPGQGQPTTRRPM